MKTVFHEGEITQKKVTGRLAIKSKSRHIENIRKQKERKAAHAPTRNNDRQGNETDQTKTRQ